MLGIGNKLSTSKKDPLYTRNFQKKRSELSSLCSCQAYGGSSPHPEPLASLWESLHRPSSGRPEECLWVRTIMQLRVQDVGFGDYG